jgi:mutator protein MutT
LRPSHPHPAIHVVAAAVTDEAGRILIAQRPPGKHLAGGWEFPGGKLEPGEARRPGLARELREELGIVMGTPRPLMRLTHTYPYGEVLLDMWVVRQYGGEPRGLDGQAIRWCTQAELATVELLPADGPIVAALRLPPTLRQAASADYAISDACGADTLARLRGVFCEGLADVMAASDAGADFLVLRNELPHAEIASICELIPVPVYIPSVSLEEAWALGASGVSELRALDARRRIV